MRASLEDWSERSRDLATLLGRAGVGDNRAFATLYDKTGAHLLAVILRINQDRAQAEDILQEVFVNIWRAASSFDAAQSQPLTWMTSVARNKAIDSLRRRQSQPQVHSAPALPDDEDGAEWVDHLPDDAPGPLDLLTRASDAQSLTHCMQSLSAQQRQSVALAFYDGLSHAEVAEQLHQPLGTVKSWVRRGLASLKDCLDRGLKREATAAPLATAALDS
ncbi:MAG: sigma-70 family RNA polymerase sigma factor [Pseudomonadota bacterium]